MQSILKEEKNLIFVFLFATLAIFSEKIIFSLINNKPIEMALTPVQTGMVLITILVSFMNQHDGESNAIEGMTHFVLFLTFIMLAFIGY